MSHQFKVEIKTIRIDKDMIYSHIIPSIIIQIQLKAVKIKYKWILPFIILFALILGLTSGCVVAENSTTAQIISTNGALPYTSTINPWFPIPMGNGFIVGYYINPSRTPLSEIDFNDLKNAGITDVYVLVTDDNYLTVLSATKTKADVVGIRTNAWVYPGFNYASQVAQMKIGVLLDVETHDIPAYVPQIQAMRFATQGVTFSLCVKPDEWDGNQYYYLIAPLCDYIVPMLYIGDYGQDINGLTKWVKIYNIYNIIYPGKIIAGLETYQSDQDVTPKNASIILAEIKAVQPYTRGVILFRYGLSNL